MESLGMWEDMLSIVDSETGDNERRLFVQDDAWDGYQYIRCRSLAAGVGTVNMPRAIPRAACLLCSALCAAMRL